MTQASERPPATAPLSHVLALFDYDGTVTTHECNEVVLQRFTGDAWRPLEDAVRRGEMSHADCFARQVAFIQAPQGAIIAAAVAAAEIAPGFSTLLDLLLQGGARPVVVSTGFRTAIRSVWRRERLPAVPIFASRLESGPDGAPPHRLVFEARFGDCPVCGPGGCKAGVLRSLRRPGDVVAVFGDGVGDVCLAREADLVFGRGMLAKRCRAEGIPCLPLDFGAAEQALAALVREPAPDVREAP